MTPIVIYKTSTGEIVAPGGIQFEDGFREAQIHAALLPWGDGHGLCEGWGDPGLHYVAVLDGKPVVADRSPLIVRTQDDRTTLAADGVDSIALTGLPDPCEIIVDDPDPGVETDVITVNGGGFVFIADDPGVYTVEVRRWPFVPFKIEFTAT